jgi:DNA-binding MarR family transcriptional regulator
VTADAVVRIIEQTCRTVIDGRRAARALTAWARRFELTEAEFQLLWSLRAATGDGLDQTTLAKKLLISPAQISTTVERAHARQWILRQTVPGDRRRHLWRLTPAGQQLLDEMLAAAGLLRYELTGEIPRKTVADVPGEAAA